ncbi:MAG: iron-containing alcohol dehydrogenase [Bacteroidales bacterium]|nr:iron-containing alcohol dehydrogenase [Bacteroidales bacterium]
MFNHPQQLIWGVGCVDKIIGDLQSKNLKRLYVVTVPVVADMISELLIKLKKAEIVISVNKNIIAEPTFSDAENLIQDARLFGADSVAGIGGGSVMDTAKVVAAMIDSDQTVKEITGIGLLKSRNTYLACIPTTSGTGSEVSPNSILMDDVDYLKKGIISPFLVPDSAFIDPALTLGLPPDITASTGIDALTHCIEAYTNKHAHPMADTLALEGIRLIGGSLSDAVKNGKGLEARSKLSLGSVYGGMCLGPVNTAAVHALAYPLGSDYKLAHGLSNAVLLPWVMEYNLEACPERYAEVAVALGCKRKPSDLETANEGVKFIRTLLHECGLPGKLSSIGVSAESYEKMASSAFQVQRLLKNNPREITIEDIKNIYQKAY